MNPAASTIFCQEAQSNAQKRSWHSESQLSVYAALATNSIASRSASRTRLSSITSHS